MTIHQTVIVRTLMRWMALFLFWSTGWKAEGRRPDVARYVVIAAPHTSNWDFIYTLALAFIFEIDPRIMMKDAWFRWPLGSLFRWLGALPIDRTQSRNTVAQSVAAFHRASRMVLVVPPREPGAVSGTGKPAFTTSPRVPECPSPWASSITAARWAASGPCFSPPGTSTAT